MQIRANNGKRYNTEAAKKIGTSADGMSLYRKSTGEYFLHRGEETTVHAMQLTEAQEWAKSNLSAEEYNAGFSYSKKSKPALYSLPEYAVEKLRAMAAEQKKPASEVLTDLIMGQNDSRSTYELYKIRMVNANDGAAYVGISVGSFKKWAAEIGAIRRFGRSVRYDLSIIDNEIDKKGARG